MLPAKLLSTSLLGHLILFQLYALCQTCGTMILDDSNRLDIRPELSVTQLQTLHSFSR